jgi:hypothetical protein
LYCDPVGAGKSLVILSLVSESPLVKSRATLGLYADQSTCVFKAVEPEEVYPLTVIVVPNTLFTQWKEYIVTQTNLTFYPVEKKKDIETLNYEGKDIVLVNANFYQSVVCKFPRISRVVFDEVHMMAIPNSYKINASFYWFISASPSEIDRFTGRKHGFLTNCLKRVLEFPPKCGLVFRNNQDIIDQSIHLPRANINILKVKCSNILNVLHGIVGSHVLESIAAGDIYGAMNQLSLEVTDEDHIIGIVNSHLQMELESHEQELKAKMIRHYSTPKAKEDALKLVEDKIDEVKRKIQDIKDRIFKDNIDPITYEEIQNPVISKCCQNKFEFSSLTEWLLKTKAACPMCRKPMNPKELVAIGNPRPLSIVIQDNDVFESKEEAILKLLQKLPKKAKILISSGPTGNFSALLHAANETKRSIRQLMGNIQTKNKILSDFKNGTLDILYLPAYESGSGLNLIETTDMILYHKMPNGIEDQVIGRSQRLGRQNSLNIWKIYYENEL